jgi:hypothetical protein
VTPIRPNVFPAPPATTSVAGVGADAARLAAQKAFFAAAMGQAAAPSAAQPAAAPRVSFFAPAPAPTARPEIRPDPSAEAPAKLLRPGSLLDIRV